MADFNENGNYPAGKGYEVCAHVDGNGTPEVSVSSSRVWKTFLHVSPADAREIAAALLVAADHADRDAGTERLDTCG